MYKILACIWRKVHPKVIPKIKILVLITFLRTVDFSSLRLLLLPCYWLSVAVVLFFLHDSLLISCIWVYKYNIKSRFVVLLLLLLLLLSLARAGSCSFAALFRFGRFSLNASFFCNSCVRALFLLLALLCRCCVCCCELSARSHFRIAAVVFPKWHIAFDTFVCGFSFTWRARALHWTTSFIRFPLFRCAPVTFRSIAIVSIRADPIGRLRKVNHAHRSTHSVVLGDSAPPARPIRANSKHSHGRLFSVSYVIHAFFLCASAFASATNRIAGRACRDIRIYRPRSFLLGVIKKCSP